VKNGGCGGWVLWRLDVVEDKAYEDSRGCTRHRSSSRYVGMRVVQLLRSLILLVKRPTVRKISSLFKGDYYNLG
jgi:hypothetical protein